ncbi:hypothetical protein [Vulcanisaeta distributa]|uniref:Uncharacterized protein n=1 Tax=Vulcanisaeta distributa (strain DSM 14429 / JCM 11212 / NBRC 100878 / IC-017) TaxID=572478 RepID=E1QSP1_VULDI|nr:hypothetical protein [Vulcanisaeta distributa]ADN49558.1 conserved hypothetical protein [Vulcanisaeta distributa DSM 14429]
MDVGEVVADLVFIVRAPVDGVDNAVNESAKLSRAWRRIATVMRAFNNPWALPRGFRRELLSIANSYFTAGSDPSITFLALMSKFSNWLNQQLDWQGKALTAVIIIAVMLGVASFMAILGAPPTVSIIGIALLPIIHHYQVELVRYDYTKPAMAGLIGGLTAFTLGNYLVGLGATRLWFITALGFGVGFAVLYMPQFIRFVANYLGLPQRVLSSFNDLLTVPNPQPPRPLTVVERDLKPLWDYAYGVGVREFVERVNMVVDSLIDFIRRSVMMGFIYGPFIAVGYAFMVFTAYVLAGIHATAITGLGMPISLDPQLVNATLMPLAITTSILVGKAMHSVGLGISLVPIFLAPLIPLIW